MGVRIAELVCLAIALLPLGGCSPERAASSGSKIGNVGSPPAEQLHGRVEIWSWNIAAESLTHLIPEFERQHPGVHVNVNMNGARLQSRLLLALSAGVGAPDISQLQLVDAQRYTYTGALTDLTPIAAKYKDLFPSPQWSNC